MKLIKEYISYKNLLFIVFISVMPFLIYFYNFHEYPLSMNTNDWGGFGSFIGGVFTFFSGVVSSLTLLLIIRSQRGTEEHQSEEMKLIRFQQYDFHQKSFKRTLSNYESMYETNIKFKNKNILYKFCFPNNSIHSVCFESKIANLDSQNSLSTCISLIKEFIKIMEKEDLSKDDGRQLLGILDGIRGNLCLEFEIKPRDFDVVVDDGSTVFVACSSSIKSTFYRHLAAVNELLNYMGEKPISPDFSSHADKLASQAVREYVLNTKPNIYKILESPK